MRTKYFLFLTGFLSLVAQIALLREINAVYYGIELIYLIGIGLWLSGTAAGTWLGKKVISDNFISISILLIIIAVLIPSDIFLIRATRTITGEARGSFLPFHLQLISIFIIIFPVAALNGILFKLAGYRYLIEGNSLAAAYSIESAGGLIGGLASYLLILAGVSNSVIILLTSIIALTGAVKHRKPASLLFILLLTGLIFLNKIDLFLHSFDHPFITEARDTPYGRLIFEEYREQKSVFLNGNLLFESESDKSEEFIGLTLTQRNKYGHILLLGGALEGLVDEVLKYSPDTLTVIEYDKSLVESSGYNFKTFSSSVVNILIDDPRKYLSNNQKYDLIISSAIAPVTAEQNRFYTIEFFNLCNRHLRNDGLMTLRTSSGENVWSRQLRKQNSYIYASLNTVFRNIIFLPGSQGIIMASNSILIDQPDKLSLRLPPEGERKLVDSNYLSYMYSDYRLEQINNYIDKNSEPNRDTRPFVFLLSTGIWLSKFFPGLEITDTVLEIVSIFTILVILIILFILQKYERKKFKSSLLGLIFFSGFAGMLLESALILQYQISQGVLYRDLGILVTIYMGGLWAGSSLSTLMGKKKIVSATNLIFYLSLSLNIFLVYLLIAYNISGNLFLTGIMIFLSSGLTAAVFGNSAAIINVSKRSLIPLLYTIDLSGGIFAALTGGLLFIPYVGAETTLIAMLLLSFLPLLFLLRAGSTGGK